MDKFYQDMLFLWSRRDLNVTALENKMDGRCFRGALCFALYRRVHIVVVVKFLFRQTLISATPLMVDFIGRKWFRSSAQRLRASSR